MTAPSPSPSPGTTALEAMTRRSGWPSSSIAREPTSTVPCRTNHPADGSPASSIRGSRIRYPSPSAYNAWVLLMFATQAAPATALMTPALLDRPRPAEITRSAPAPRPKTSRVPSGIAITRPPGVVTCAVAGIESSAIAVLPVLPVLPVPPAQYPPAPYPPAVLRPPGRLVRWPGTCAYGSAESWGDRWVLHGPPRPGPRTAWLARRAGKPTGPQRAAHGGHGRADYGRTSVIPDTPSWKALSAVKLSSMRQF